MALINCPECDERISENAIACPKCGNPLKPGLIGRRWGYEWKSNTEILGFPLIHIAIGWNPKTGKLYLAKGIIAIGQFGIGLITIAQFGIGLLFGFGQFTGGLLAIGQFALGVYFGLGQFATGLTVIGQFAFGKYVLAQLGLGEFVWSVKIKNPVAIKYFKDLFQMVLRLF